MEFEHSDVSIIVRTQGRRPRLLNEALKSLAVQTYSRLEVVVVEDGSDTLLPLVESLGRDRPNCFRHLPIAAAGRSQAGNVGLAAATGDWLGFLDEDDALYPEHVAILRAAVTARPERRLVFARAAPEVCFGLSHDRADRPRLAEPVGDAPFSRLNLWASNRYAIQSGLFHRDLPARYGGFDPALTYLEDWDLWLRYTADLDATVLPQVTSKFRVPAEAQAEAVRRRRHTLARPAVLARHAERVGSVRFSDVAALEDRADRQHTVALGVGVLLIVASEQARLLWEWLMGGRARL